MWGDWEGVLGSGLGAASLGVSEGSLQEGCAPTSCPIAAPGSGQQSLLQPMNADPKRWEEEGEQERKGKELTPVIKLKASSQELAGAGDAWMLWF